MQGHYRFVGQEVEIPADHPNHQLMYKCAPGIQVVIRDLPHLFHEEEDIGSEASEVIS